MPGMIKRKFLVDIEKWNSIKSSLQGERIRQAYIFISRNKSLRVRIKGDVAQMKFKAGESVQDQTQVVSTIQMDDAIIMIEYFSEAQLDKIRYDYLYKGLKWEIDVFLGKNNGLVIAQAVPGHINIIVEKPDWLKEEVTHDARYLSVNLSLMPFSTWSKK